MRKRDIIIIRILKGRDGKECEIKFKYNKNVEERVKRGGEGWECNNITNSNTNDKNKNNYKIIEGWNA